MMDVVVLLLLLLLLHGHDEMGSSQLLEWKKLCKRGRDETMDDDDERMEV